MVFCIDLVEVQYLAKRKHFLKSNPEFINKGKIARLTSKHLYIQENLPGISEDDFTREENRISLGNSMWKNLDISERLLYTERVKDMSLQNLRSESRNIINDIH